MATTVLAIPALPPPVHPLNPPTPPATSTPVFKFTATISTRPATPSSVHSAPDTPPASPSDDTQSIESTESSLTVPSESPLAFALHPPDRFQVIRHRERATIYAIEAADLALAYQQTQTQVMPPAPDLFPWLHGLNPRNSGQLAFFNAQCSAARLPPINIGYRGLTIIHVPAPFGGYRPGRLVGAVNHTEILGRTQRDGHFLDPDPPKGICLRNFHIQVAKMALLSDIVVYSPRGQTKEVLDVAEKIAQAQRFVRMKYSTSSTGAPIYNTFVVTDDIEVFERNHPDLVAIDSCGRTTDNRLEFLNQEREEMRRLTTATKISENVYLGNSADVSRSVIECIDEDGKVSTRGFDVAIEAKDAVQVASAAALRDAETFLNGGVSGNSLRNGWYSHCLTRPVSLEFPSSSPPTSRHDPEAIIAFCEWIYHIAHTPAVDHTDFDMIDSDMPDSSTRTILIYCLDGYTESTFLALAYIMFAEGITAHEAWMRLHLDLQRSFFAFETDLKVLTYLEPHLLARSPSSPSFVGMSSPLNTPSWFTHVAFDGSFPSRILPHMYLGNLNHANNPEMLRALGITRVLSIGEQVVWDVEKELAAGMQLLYLDNVQDNGIDPLLDYIDACLEFLDAGYRAGEKTLVHCRVGVSRSASICIAEVMRRTSLSLPRAYLFVRARRLNVIIQPNLRFMYELLKWEELEFARNLEQRKLDPFTDQSDPGFPREYKREMEWASLCKEIADLNKTYTGAA